MRPLCSMTRRHCEPTRAMDLATPGIMRHGSSIKLKGSSVDGAAKHFTLQLITLDGIALFMYVPLQGEIILNSFRAGRWEQEERHFNSQIKPGSRFHLKIKHKHDFLVIKVNGHLICHFHHRDMPNNIRTFAIKGDIRVEDVRFKKFKYQHRDGPAVVVHPNVPPPPFVQQVVVSQSPQIVVQSAPQTIIHQQAPVYTHPPPNQMTSIEVAAAAQVMADGPPPYTAHEYPPLPVKV